MSGNPALAVIDILEKPAVGFVLGDEEMSGVKIGRDGAAIGDVIPEVLVLVAELRLVWQGDGGEVSQVIVFVCDAPPVAGVNLDDPAVGVVVEAEEIAVAALGAIYLAVVTEENVGAEAEGKRVAAVVAPGFEVGADAVEDGGAVGDGKIGSLAICTEAAVWPVEGVVGRPVGYIPLNEGVEPVGG